MRKISNESTEIKLNGLVSNRQSNYNKLNHESFSSLLNQEKESSDEGKEEVVSKSSTHQEVLLQNQAYLNKIYLHLVA